MLDVGLAHPTDLDGWRGHARGLIARQIQPDVISWRVSGEVPDLCRAALPSLPAASSAIAIRRGSVSSIACCGGSLGESGGFSPFSPTRTWFGQSDLHKMKAFVRFRSTEDEGVEHFIAWFEPRHFIVERAAPFFARRFAGTLWSILTPDRSAHWDGERLSFGPGTDKPEEPSEDALADVWRRYYASIFNPARLKLKAMKGQMPVRYWKNLPRRGLADFASYVERAGRPAGSCQRSPVP